MNKKVSASTQNQALSAILFLYQRVLDKPLEWVNPAVRAKKPKRLPVVLTREEVRTILGSMDGAPKLVATLLYGAGLRLNECLELRFKDIDFTTNQILVRDGKGQKDRITTLPASVKEALLTHLRNVWRLHQGDLRAGVGRVVLPYALARKYPNADREWGWQWAFPAASRYFDKEAKIERRHHLHETAVQKAMRQAVLRAGIGKPARLMSCVIHLPHTCWKMATTSVQSRSY